MNLETQRILLLDDDPDQWVLLRRMLADQVRYSLSHANDLESLHKALQESPFMILCDYRMGEYTGPELLHLAGVNLDIVPVVVLTEVDSDFVIREVVQAGAVDYLTKSNLSKERLLDTIRHAQAQHANRLALRASRRLLLAVLDHTPQCIWWKTPEGSYAGCNQRFAQWVKLEKPSAIFGRRDADLPCSSAELFFLQQCNSEALQGTPFLARIFEVPNALGQMRILEASARPLPFPDGSGNGVLCTFDDVTERIQARRQIGSLQTALQGVAESVVVLDAQQRVLYANLAFFNLFGLPATLSGAVLTDYLPKSTLIPPPPPPGENLSSWKGEFSLRMPQGSTVSVEYSVALTGEGGSITILRDITARRATENALRRAEEKYRNIFEHTSEGIFQTSPEGRFISANPSLASILGYESSDELLNSVKDIANQIYVDASTRDKFLELCTKGPVQEFEAEVHRKDGSIIWISENARPIFSNDGKVLYFEGTLEDISRRKRTEDELFRLAFFHPLTHLPNRSKLIRDLDALLQPPTPPFTLVVLNLDRFKLVNDSLGPMYGDQMIQEMARRLLRTIPPDCPAYSLGADEFAVILHQIVGENELHALCSEIQVSLARPLMLGKREIICTASLGSVRSTLGYRSPENLLRAADTAMTRAKENGGNQYVSFQYSMYQKVLTRLEMEDELRKGMENEEFVVFFQPIISMENPPRPVGCEALVRWQHPDKGFVSPMQFIPVTEETGLIVTLGAWILRHSLIQVRQWQLNGNSELFVSVNVSVQQFQSGNLTQIVRSALEESGMSPASLRLEITESIAMKNVEYTVNTFRELHEMGVHLSIDDFGTGYSSLAYLKKFPFHTLKIDRSFVQDLQRGGQQDNLMVQTIATLARNLNLEVVAEGVETEQQAEALRHIGIRYCQGFLYGRPLPATKFLDWLQDFKTK